MEKLSNQEIVDFAAEKGCSAILENDGSALIKIPTKDERLTTLMASPPDHCFEWSVSIKDPKTSEELFYIWWDYQGYGDGKSKALLTKEFFFHLKQVIGILLTYESRITTDEGVKFLKWRFFKSIKLEMKTESGWNRFEELLEKFDN